MVKWLNSFLFCVLVTLFSVETPAQNNKIDSLINVLKTAKEDSAKIKNLNALSKLYRNTGEYDKALHYAETARMLSEKLNFKRGLIISFQNIGIIYNHEGNYIKAMEYFSAALKVPEVLGDKKTIANLNGNIGLIFDKQGNYPRALEYYIKALKIHEEIGNKSGISAALNNIGLINWNQGEYSKALEEYFQSLAISEAANDKIGIATTLNNIGGIYGEQKEYTKALEQHFKALKIREEIRDIEGVAASLSNIGITYKQQSESIKNNDLSEGDSLLTLALDQYLKSLSINLQIGDQDAIASNYINLGVIYTLKGKYVMARKYLTEALAISKETGNIDDIKYCLSGLSDLENAVGNHKKSLEHFKQFIIYRDSLLNEENTKKTVQQQMQYDFDKKEGETKAEQNKKDVIAEEEKQKQKIIIASVSFGLLLVLILAIVIFRSLRQNQKKNKIITEQKLIVEHQKELVEEKQKEILDSIHYAKRIQTALITSEKYIFKSLNKLSQE